MDKPTPGDALRAQLVTKKFILPMHGHSTCAADPEVVKWDDILEATAALPPEGRHLEEKQIIRVIRQRLNEWRSSPNVDSPYYRDKIAKELEELIDGAEGRAPTESK